MTVKLRHVLWGLLALAGLGATAYVGVMAYWVSRIGNMCEYTLREAHVSPDGRLRAGVALADCGALGAANAWALLAPAGRPFDYRKDRFAVVDSQALRVHWEGQTLVVQHRVNEPMERLRKPHPRNVVYRPL